jgi:ABC-type sugar transport system ATPase subunit
MGVILITDEIPEAVANSNRILLMRAGRVRSELATEGVQAEDLQRAVEAGQ